jgi:hypothetical protein
MCQDWDGTKADILITQNLTLHNNTAANNKAKRKQNARTIRLLQATKQRERRMHKEQGGRGRAHCCETTVDARKPEGPGAQEHGQVAAGQS